MSVKKKLPVLCLVLFDIGYSFLRFVTKFFEEREVIYEFSGRSKAKVETNFPEMTVLFEIGLEVIFVLVAVVGV